MHTGQKAKFPEMFPAPILKFRRTGVRKSTGNVLYFGKSAGFQLYCSRKFNFSSSIYNYAVCIETIKPDDGTGVFTMNLVTLLFGSLFLSVDEDTYTVRKN